MLRVKAGELDKLGLLFERYKKKLFSYFYRLTGRREISEDLVQGVFERVLRYRHTYDNGHAFSTWIYQIARNLHSDHYRKTQSRRDLDEWVDPDDLKGPATAHHELESPEERELNLLQWALDRLDPEKKETLVLSRYQGFRYKEIAAIMNCSESAVKVRIYRAINELREMINEMKAENYD